MSLMRQAVTQFHLWRLSKPLLGGRRWYQYVEFGNSLTTERWGAGNMQSRTTSFLQFLERQTDLQSDDVVVDIGSNAGLFTLTAAQTCHHATGVEIDSAFDRQARFLKGRWQADGYRVDNVTFVRGSITEHLEIVMNATVVLASKVLYHNLLGESLDQLMEAIEIGSARLIVMQGHSIPVRGEIGTDAGMRNLFEKHGFQYELAASVPEYPIAVAIRPPADGTPKDAI